MASEAYVPPDIASIMGVIDTHLRWKQVQEAGSRSYLHYHPSEWGKAQPLDANVQTPSGPRRMGDLKVGDKVCDPHGSTTKIEQIHPQGTKDIYKITFVDGDSVECCEDHLWEVYNTCFVFSKPRVLTTCQLIDQYLHAEDHVFSVRKPDPLFIDAYAPSEISPYLMGVILAGDCLRYNNLDFTTVDDEVMEKVALSLPDTYETRSWSNNARDLVVEKISIYEKFLENLGLKGLSSEERFIPDAYLYTSVEDRKELLKGLMDTNETIDTRGDVGFSTVSSKLAEQVKWLVNSLGGIGSIRHVYIKNILLYRCDISVVDTSDLFHLSHKKQSSKKLQFRQSPLKRTIANIEFCGKKDAQCITVSNRDGLYLTNHCIVTHNCLRAQQYKHFADLGYIDVETTINSSQLQRLFDKGHNMHLRWQQWYFADMGVLRGRWKCKNMLCYAFDEEGNNHYDNLSEKQKSQINNHKTRIYGGDNLIGSFKPDRCICGCSEFEYLETQVVSDELNFKGHADIILDFSRFDSSRYDGVRKSFNVDVLPKKPIVVDMKTMGDWQWRNKLKQTGVPQEHMIQVVIYTHLLGCEYGVLIYENKDNSKYSAHKVEPNQDIFDTVKRQSTLMQQMTDRRLLPPPKPDDKSSYECQKCEFAKLCHESPIWDNDNLHELRKGFYDILL